MRTRFALVWMAAAMAAVSSVRAGYSPEVGRRHPDFTLPDIATGRPVSLSDYRGRRVLLIHFAGW